MEHPLGVNCRLCAGTSIREDTLNKVLDRCGVGDENVLQKITINCSIVNIDEELATPVCLPCSVLVKSAVNFTISAQTVQTSLRNILRGINPESKVLWNRKSVSFTMDIAENSSTGVSNVKNYCELDDSDDQKGTSENSENSSDLDLSEYVKVQLSNNDEEDSDDGSKKRKLSKKKRQNVKNLKKRKQTWKYYAWTCYVCGSVFKSIKELTSHSIAMHNNCTTYKCTDCDKRNLKLNTFVHHVKKHRSYLRFSCHLCYEVFPQAKDVLEHLLDHFLDQHVCEGCNSCFTDSDELGEHLKTYHQHHRKFMKTTRNEEGLLCCDSCDKTFAHRSMLSKHRFLYHSGREKKHTCDICGARYYSKRELKVHIVTKHCDETPYTCQICTLSFKTYRRLQIHTQRHEIASIPCNICGRIFRTDYLRRKHHERIHLNLPHVLCSECGKSFKTELYLKRHMIQHTGAKPFSCATCVHQFTNWSNYAKHMRLKHGIEVAKRKRTLAGPFPVNAMKEDVVLPLQSEDEAEQWVAALRLKRE